MVGSIVTILGDFYFWLDNLETRYVKQFMDVITSFGLVNVVNKPTSVCGHTIDLILVDLSKDIVCTISPVLYIDLYHSNWKLYWKRNK